MHTNTSFRHVLLPIVIAGTAAITGASCSPVQPKGVARTTIAAQTADTAPETTDTTEAPGPTLSQFKALREGMTVSEVQAILGSPGTEKHSSINQSYPEYSTLSIEWGSGRYGTVYVFFTGGKASNLSHFGLKN